MTGILVLAHGSRATETEATLEQVLNMVRGKLPDVTLAHAFMEFSEQTIEKGIKKLVERGATHIKVVPYFLFTGVHLKEDIPGMMKACMANYPNVKVTIAETLGTDDRLADIVADRIKD